MIARSRPREHPAGEIDAGKKQHNGRNTEKNVNGLSELAAQIGTAGRVGFDRERNIFDFEGFSDYVARAVKLALPEAVAEHGDLLWPDRVEVNTRGREQPTDFWGSAENRVISPCDRINAGARKFAVYFDVH
ncbi:MAG: hypothetical protein WA020_07355 [Candidatus Acidiferrales bacterium]